MKKRVKKMLCVLLSLCMMILPLPATVSAALADSATVAYAKNLTLSLYGKTQAVSARSNVVRIPNIMDDTYTNVKATTSNSRIVALNGLYKVTPESENYGEYVSGDWPANAKTYLLVLRTKRTGDVKITIKGTKNGKRVSKYINIKVVKYQNPFSSLTINKREYKAKYDGASGTITVKTGSAYNFAYTLKNGYQLKNKTLQVKSSKYTVLHLEIYNTATKITECYNIRFKK